MKNKIITIIFLIYIFTIGILGIVFKDKDISLEERRTLEHVPEFTLNNEYITKIDKYLLDQFPFRNKFRSIKAFYNYNVLGSLANNDIYIKDNYIFKSEYPTNKKSINNFINKTNNTIKSLTQDNNVYVMIIPDKNYYIDSKDFLSIDYDYLYNEVSNINAKFIDIRDIMQLDDYYETDTHWKQERLDKVIKKMSEVIEFNYKDIEYDSKTYDKFYGVYYGESAVNRKPEKLTYLINDIILNSRVEYLENSKSNKVYSENKLAGMDAYDVYLDGASSFIEIYNDNSDTDKELVIFRDSFGSSLTPLLINYYKKITLIDNRYIYSAYYSNMIEFDKQDVLFMYSTLVVNNSVTLKG